MENSPTDQQKHPSNLTEFRPDFKLYDIELCRDKMESLCDAAVGTSMRVSKQFHGLPVPAQKNKNMRHVHDDEFPNVSWLYGYYNFFGCNARNSDVYDLYCQMRSAIRDYIGQNCRAWMQCWVNTHRNDDLMAKHHHTYPIHGYLSLYPQNTATVFYDGYKGGELYRITNECGKMYIGIGSRPHEVVATGDPPNPMAPRITLGFNVLRNNDIEDFQCDTFSFIPV